MGLWLRAGALRQPDALCAPLKEALDQAGWVDADSVAQAACELAVKAAYAPGNTTFPVPEFVRGIREFFAADGNDKFPQREGELLVRAALGEQIATDNIDLAISFAAHSLIFAGVMLALRCSAEEIEAHLVEAEKLALSRGFAPTPAAGHMLAG